MPYVEAYPCPACRLGRLETMTLMDSLACPFCRHIFAPDPKQALLWMVDGLPPLAWQWNGQSWQSPHGQGIRLADKVTAVIIVLLPTLLVGLSAYSFRPLPTSPLSWFPLAWTGLTFVCHLAGIVGVWLAYYQISVVTVLKSAMIRLRGNT